MKTFIVISILTAVTCCFSFSFRRSGEYRKLYTSSVAAVKQGQSELLGVIKQSDLSTDTGRENVRQAIHASRRQLKAADFWLRYFEPVAYRKLNGPLPVEWETEVFEKFEPPYKRIGAGLTLAELSLDEPEPDRNNLTALIITANDSLATFEADSITSQLNSYHHFFLANRLFLLNLSAIYTTGFECPDTSRIIPELRDMLMAVKDIYTQFNHSFPETPLPADYTTLYAQLIDFANRQPGEYSLFDHFVFLRDYINPLFRLNQHYIRDYQVVTQHYNDYALSDTSNSLFDKSLFLSQNTKGIFSLVDDEAILAEVKNTGKLLFYDPILSGNNKRSCASCHKPTEYFTDTTMATPLQFDRQQPLPRNAPSLINAVFNHLVMLDGKHISLQGQAREVITTGNEMNSDEKELVKKVMSCKIYRDAFKKFLPYTPEEKNVSLDHIVSAVTMYYASFSNYYSPFDEAITEKKPLAVDARKGFNLFMSKAQCGTCHFVPHFNGVKPPYIGSEFEVLGVPADTAFHQLSNDNGRYGINPAQETLHAFRTGTVRNSEFTKPYMHNGVFNTLDQLIDFYDAGGGTGRKLKVDNQTLSTDSLKLSPAEKADLKAFLHSLNEKIIFETPPPALPASSIKSLNSRKTGGEY